VEACRLRPLVGLGTWSAFGGDARLARAVGSPSGRLLASALPKRVERAHENAAAGEPSWHGAERRLVKRPPG
jgi:hypothetical protein